MSSFYTYLSISQVLKDFPFFFFLLPSCLFAAIACNMLYFQKLRCNLCLLANSLRDLLETNTTQITHLPIDELHNIFILSSVNFFS